MKHIALIATFVLATSTFAQIEPNLLNNYKIPNVVWADNAYYYVMPQRQAVYGAVEKVSPRFDSRYLGFVASPTAHREIPDPSMFPFGDGNLGVQQGIYVYDLVANRAILVRPLPSDRFQLKTLDFPEESPYLYGSFTENDNEQAFIYHPETAKYLTISSEAGWQGSLRPLYVKSTDSFVFVNQKTIDPAYAEISVLNVKNGSTSSFRLPQISPSRIVTQNGRLVVIEFDRTGQTYTAVQEINPSNGTITRISEPYDMGHEPKLVVTGRGPYIGVGSVPFSASNSSPESFEGKSLPRVMLTANGLFGGATPNEKIIWYTERSGLYLSDIVQFTDTQANTFFKEAIKQDTIARAKQVGIALNIYSSDYDGLYPPLNNWQENTNPYIRTRSMFDGFNYLLNGQNREDITDPNTPLGTIDTPYGTATITVDGSIIWKDRPKSNQAQTPTELRT